PPSVGQKPQPPPLEAEGEDHLIATESRRPPLLQNISELEALIHCTRCSRAQSCGGGVSQDRAKRSYVVPGIGTSQASIFFIDLNPGPKEEQVSLPLVEPAVADLFQKILASLSLSRAQVYHTYLTKCGTRPPRREEIQACLPHLEKELERVQPRVVVTLGFAVSQALFEPTDHSSLQRGQWTRWRDYRVMPTFHPAEVFRGSEVTRAELWRDIKRIRNYLESEG
ncbi:MAG: uracil-DNA glycosylase, partial [Myxococcota bacterium]|nr:uracil-DNA glycosylase [Myxococcota bacterium]